MSMDFFRGYVRVNGKRPLRKFKDVSLSTLEEVQDAKSYAGVLSENTILIDVDDAEQAELLLRIVEDKNLSCRVHKTTRGKHFFFRNSQVKKCFTHVRLACGIVADIKVGKVSSYAVLKKDGVVRPTEYDIFQDDGDEYQEIPAFLLPVRSSPDFAELEQGDGRNQKLYNYILTLQAEKFTKEDVRETLRIINKYIFKEPLDEKELETLSRDEAFQKETFFDGKSFEHDRFANFLRSEYHIIRINGQLHIYSDGVYRSGYRNIEGKMISHIPTLKKAQRAEVLAQLEIICTEEYPMSDADYIAFRNGVYRVSTGELLPFSAEHIILNKIDWNYNPDAQDRTVDSFFQRLSAGDGDIAALLGEIVGYCFYRRNELRTAFILKGGLRNGKSTYLKMLHHLLGDENTSSLDIRELNERFKTVELMGKLANIGDDIEDGYLRDMAIFKKLVSGEPVTAEFKGRDAFSFRNYSKLIFSANNPPRIKDKTGAAFDRFIMVPLDVTFTKDDPDYDPFIIDKLITEGAMERLIILGLEGLKRVLKSYGFTQSESGRKMLEEYRVNSNPILLYFEDFQYKDIVNHSTQDLYSKYGLFCNENGFSPMGKIEFVKEVNRTYQTITARKTVNGVRQKVFAPKDGKTE